MNANRGFSAVLHARATRGILFSLRTAWHVHPPSNGYILLGEEEGREYSLFAILPCIDSNGAFPSFQVKFSLLP